MNVLATARNIRHRGARSALIAGLFAWLSFLVQPCVVAAPLAGTAGQHDAGPPAGTHYGSGSRSDTCLHCFDDTSTRNFVPSTCDDASAASQSPVANPLDSGENGWTPALPFSILPDIHRVVLRSTGMHEAERLPRNVSLTVAYCVFLE